MFSRLGAKESLGDVGFRIFSHISGGLIPHDVVEFSGTEGTGKTELLLNIVAHCTLPKAVACNASFGKEVEVVFVCTDHKFDLLRLVTILEAKLNATRGGEEAPPAAAVKDTVKSCLSRIHVVHCSSSSELNSTLDFLRATYLPRRPEVAAIVLDNVASFYWIDKTRADPHWVRALSELIRERHLILFAAKPLLVDRTSKSCGSDDFMCRPWRQLVKYRFLLQKAGKLPGNTPDFIFRCTQLPPLHTSQPPACNTFTVKESGVHFLSS